MQSYSLKLGFPQDKLTTAVLLLISAYFLLISLRFIKNIKSGATLIIYGNRINFFTIRPGKLEAGSIADFENSKPGIVWGSTYLTPIKTAIYGIFFIVATLFAFSLIFTQIQAI
jgi:hypothetical protein